METRAQVLCFHCLCEQKNVQKKRVLCILHVPGNYIFLAQFLEKYNHRVLSLSIAAILQ